MPSGSLTVTTSALSLSHYVYRAEVVRKFEPIAAQQDGCAMYGLMEQAGQALSQYIHDHYGYGDKIVLLAGSGNNGGDAYVAAKLLKQAGYPVTMASIDPQKPLSGDAKTAQQHWLALDTQISDAQQLELNDFDLIVDGLLGTGLSGEIRPEYATLIERINHSKVDVISVDVPSGLDANTGQPHGVAVEALVTITFVGKKAGLVTGVGKFYTGQLEFSPLSIGKTFHQLASHAAVELHYDDFFALPARAQHAHKGHFGRLLCIGGNRSMSGAIRLASEAAMRCGAGLVKVFCHNDSRLQVSNGRPELMVATDHLLEHLDWADCIVFGPGLGKDGWSQDVFGQLLSYLAHEDKPIVIDADGLNLLGAQLHKFKLSKAIITPHPAEAARLLNVTTAEIEQDRYQAAQKLVQTYQASCVLKGAGSVIQLQDQCFVCGDGNPGMATAGMGDVLAGILGGLVAQGMDAESATKMAVCLHAASADMTARHRGQRGMLASDIFDSMRQLLN